MIIREMYLKNFGKYNDKRITLSQGINLIYGDNETGKTTLFTFIKGMLFGIERQRGKASKNDIYSTYEPWKNPGWYAGSMRFLSGDKIFRIDRSFSKAQKSSELICETDGEELSIEHGDLQMLLSGLGESAFQNTVSIGQLRCETDGSLAEELKNYMTNYYETGDGEINVSGSVASLKEKKKELESRLRELEMAQQQRINEISIEKNYAESGLLEKKNQMEEARAFLKTFDEKFQSNENHKNAGIKTGENYKMLLYAASVFIFLLLGTVFVLGSGLLFKFFTGTGVVLDLIFVVYVYFVSTREKNRRKNMERESNINRRNKQAEQEERKKKALWKFEQLQEEFQEKCILSESLTAGYEEACNTSPEQKDLRTEINAVQLAADTIQAISGEIHGEFGAKLNKAASDVFSGITGGRYTAITMDERMDLRIHTSEKILMLHQISRGTVEQAYFAVRMAVGELFYAQEQMPVILDDTFAMFDEQRLRTTLHWLYKNGRQVILFTCHKREQEIMDSEKIPYRRIELC